MKRTALLATILAACSSPSPLASDGGVLGDAGSVSLATLPFDTWSYVPVPGAVCGNGSPAAIGVNPHAGATELLVVMEGGGACWSAETCFVQNTAVHVHEDYTRAIFDPSIAALASSGVDDRSAATNAFRTATLVFVPYCTGDLHGGDAVQTYDAAMPERRVYHRGGRNMGLYVDAMRAAWPMIATTFVLGFSAGGYGAQLNWGRFADAWPSDALAILADSSPLVQPSGSLYATWRAAWNLQTPSDCSECATSFAAYDDYYDAHRADTRFGLLATTRDATISAYFGITDMPAALAVLLTDHLDDAATTRYFVADSDHHVLLDDVPAPSAVDGTTLASWLAGFVTNDASAWHDTVLP